ncbi:cupin domain-containing protein [Streptomyces sp. NPDC127106]|uniref:cupin domain-containing protein n=1 Tax=Streptomyces sp. NPDC127106 TaxID=3345360 RepID=UPI003636A191
MSGRQVTTERPAIPGPGIPVPGIPVPGIPVPAIRGTGRPAGVGRAATAADAGTGAPDLAGREVVIAPGACTGWHYHRVPLIVLVKSGTLTRILHDDTTVVHRAGTSFIEPAGPEHLHLGRNLGTTPVVLYVTSALAEGEPLSIPADAPAPGHPVRLPAPRLVTGPAGATPAHTRRRISPRTR